MEEQRIEENLKLYRSQLDQVECAIRASGEADNPDLVTLQADLTELVALTEESLLSLKKQRLMSTLDGQQGSNESAHGHETSTNLMDDEFAAFQAAIAEDDVTQNTEATSSITNRECVEVSSYSSLDQDLNSIEGTQCRVPYEHDWGEMQYHNAMIMSIEPLEADTEPMVSVLFSHPTHQSMMPCPFFLEDRCRFSSEECRNSHGYVVEVEKLKTYKEPDYSLLKIASPVLAKNKSGYWQRATVVELNGDHIEIMWQQSDEAVSTSLEEVWPLGIDDPESLSDSDSDGVDDEDKGRPAGVAARSSDSETEDAAPIYLWRPGQTTDALGTWEQHTRGIGSKLMAKMGYITGQGLGKTGTGRAEPVPIQLLPPGKSLDKIMELKEKAGTQDLYNFMKKQKKQTHLKKETVQKNIKAGSHSKVNVFDFINKKLCGKKGVDINKVAWKHPTKKVGTVHISEHDLKQRSDKDISVQLFKTQEEMKNVERAIAKHKEALQRNERKDRMMTSHVSQRITSLESYLKQLKQSSASLERQRKSRKDNKKLSIF